MSLLVSKPGILTTVQDLGRNGYRSLGINPGGVMDRTAARLINTLLRNSETDAVLEFHFPAGEFVFEHGCSFAIGGADFFPKLNDIEVRNWSVQTAAKGDILQFEGRRSGGRAYLAVAGGFDVNEWLGSMSTNLAASAGGFRGRPLRPGDRIEFACPRIAASTALGPSLIPRYSRFPTVRVIAGAEFGLLTPLSEQLLLTTAFSLTNNSNRMGFRLFGEPLHLLEAKELVSASVAFGTIQLLPDGQLIVLMADHQTSGGYPRVASVAAADLPLLAQLGAGDGVSFHLISSKDAEDLMLDFEHGTRFLKVGLSIL